MGHLVDGTWHTGWYEPDAGGAFQRPAARFRNRPAEVAAGQYHLYAAWACPWAHRTLITRSLRGLVGAIARILDAIYAPINNGVYRAGFAGSQVAYETAVRELFAALAHWEDVLADQPFLCGARMTEADIALFTTLLRFDLVYYGHF